MSMNWPMFIIMIVFGAIGFTVAITMAKKNAKADHAEFIKPHDEWVRTHKKEISKYQFSQWLRDNNMQYPSTFNSLSKALVDYENAIERKFKQ